MNRGCACWNLKGSSSGSDRSFIDDLFESRYCVVGLIVTRKIAMASMWMRLAAALAAAQASTTEQAVDGLNREPKTANVVAEPGRSGRI